MRCGVAMTYVFKVEVRVSPFLFVMVMDEIRTEAPWTMVFVDDV